MEDHGATGIGDDRTAEDDLHAKRARLERDAIAGALGDGCVEHASVLSPVRSSRYFAAGVSSTSAITSCARRRTKSRRAGSVTGHTFDVLWCEKVPCMLYAAQFGETFTPANGLCGSVGCDVDAVDPVVGDVALHPLDLGSEAIENRARPLRDAAELRRRQHPGSRDIALDHILGQGVRGHARTVIPHSTSPRPPQRVTEQATAVAGLLSDHTSKPPRAIATRKSAGTSPSR